MTPFTPPRSGLRSSPHTQVTATVRHRCDEFDPHDHGRRSNSVSFSDMLPGTLQHAVHDVVVTCAVIQAVKPVREYDLPTQLFCWRCLLSQTLVGGTA